MCTRLLKNRSLKSSLILSFLVLVCAFILSLSLLTSYLLRAFSQKDFVTFCSNTVAQTQKSIDEQMTTMYEISSNLGNTESLFSANIRKSKSLLPSAATMRNHHVSIDIIKAYYLYYTNDAIDWVFTDQSPFNKQYFDRLHAEYAITLAELERAAQLANPQALYPLQANARYLINALKVSGDPESRRALIYLIDTQKILLPIQQAFGDELSAVRLFSPSGECLYEYAADRDSVHTFVGSSNSSISIRLEVSVCHSSTYGVIRMYGNVMFVYILLCTLLVLGLSWYLSHRIYTPISSAYHRILSNKSDPSKSADRYRELAEIETAYNLAMLEKKRLHGLADSQTSALIQNYLNALLCNVSIAESHVAFLSEQMDAAEAGSRYVLLMVCIDHAVLWRHSCDPEQQLSAERDIRAAFNRLDELCTAITSTPINEKSQMLILLSLRQTAVRSRLIDVCRRIQENVRHLTGQTVTLSVGRSFEESKSIPERWQSVQALSQRRLVEGWNALLDEETAPPAQPAVIPEENLPALKKACLSGSIKTAQAEFQRYLSALETCCDTLSFRHVYYAACSALNQLAAELLSRPAKPVPLDDPETVQEAQEILLNTLQEIMDALTEQHSLKRSNAAHEIMAFLEQNYTNSALTMDAFAREFGLSQNYLTQCFRKEYGMSISAALDQVRMRHAKELLTHSSLLVKEIVLAVGYVDVNNFIRKFKHLEGVTPLQFRKVCGLSPESDFSD